MAACCGLPWLVFCCVCTLCTVRWCLQGLCAVPLGTNPPVGVHGLRISHLWYQRVHYRVPASSPVAQLGAPSGVGGGKAKKAKHPKRVRFSKSEAVFPPCRYILRKIPMYAYVENERPIYFSLKLYLNSVAVHTSGSCYNLTGENTSTYLYTMSAIPATATQLWARANHDMADPWRNIY